MKPQNKTTQIPHRLMNKTSIYLAHQRKVDRVDFLGYEAIVDIDKEQTVTIHSAVSLVPKDGSIFDYITAQWQATLKSKPDLEEIDVDVEEIVTLLGWKSRTENRRKIIQHMRNLLNVTIIYKWNNGEITLHLLEKLRVIDSTKTIGVKVSQSYMEALKSLKGRYINVSDTMVLKGKYDIELYKLLQMSGSGVTNVGKPKLARILSHEAVCKHLHLDSGAKNNKDIIFRAFSNLHHKLNIELYKFNSNLQKWQNT